jgi:hypothetical protein
VPTFLLHHQHAPSECAVAFAAWTGFMSPLRHLGAASTCHLGGHEIWWQVQARDGAAALTLLPRFLARRTTPIEVSDVVIP